METVTRLAAKLMQGFTTAAGSWTPCDTREKESEGYPIAGCNSRIDNLWHVKYDAWPVSRVEYHVCPPT